MPPPVAETKEPNEDVPPVAVPVAPTVTATLVVAPRLITFIAKPPPDAPLALPLPPAPHKRTRTFATPTGTAKVPETAIISIWPFPKTPLKGLVTEAVIIGIVISCSP
jgi:hypothetical protein